MSRAAHVSIFSKDHISDRFIGKASLPVCAWYLAAHTQIRPSCRSHFVVVVGRSGRSRVFADGAAGLHSRQQQRQWYGHRRSCTHLGIAIRLVVDNRAWPAIAKFVCQRTHLNFSRSAHRGPVRSLLAQRRRRTPPRSLTRLIRDLCRRVLPSPRLHTVSASPCVRAVSAVRPEAGQLERVRARAGPGGCGCPQASVVSLKP